MGFRICLEFCHCTINCISFDVFLECFFTLFTIVTTTGSSCTLSSDCLSGKKIVEVLYKIFP